MALLDDLLSSVNKDAVVRSVLVGAHWTVVCSAGCGMASTIAGGEGMPHGHAPVRDAGRLHEKHAAELCEYARSDIPLEAGIGVAALNSLLPVPDKKPGWSLQEVNAAELLARSGSGQDMAVVGHFPFLERLSGIARRLWVIEQNPGQGDYPAGRAADLLPQAIVVALTGSALVNHTLESLLALCRPDALVMVLGPSTPLSPVLFDYGVDIISGVQVFDEAALLRTAGQGANFRQVEGVRLLSMVKEGQGL
jgi:uncharacterized protein